MNVTASKGLNCPREGNPREYITDAVPAEVPDTLYYRRLIADGSLILVQPARGKKAESSGGTN
jgi:hypothetical protein